MIKVLIADDEPLARKRIRDLMRHEQDLLLAGESGDGMDALAKVKQLILPSNCGHLDKRE